MIALLRTQSLLGFIGKTSGLYKRCDSQYTRLLSGAPIEIRLLAGELQPMQSQAMVLSIMVRNPAERQEMIPT